MYTPSKTLACRGSPVKYLVLKSDLGVWGRQSLLLTLIVKRLEALMRWTKKCWHKWPSCSLTVAIGPANFALENRLGA